MEPYHIIKHIDAGEVDDRDKIQLVAGTMLPCAITYCGLNIGLENRQRILRLGDENPNAFCCRECLSQLMLLKERC